MVINWNKLIEILAITFIEMILIQVKWNELMAINLNKLLANGN